MQHYVVEDDAEVDAVLELLIISHVQQKFCEMIAGTTIGEKRVSFKFILHG